MPDVIFFTFFYYCKTKQCFIASGRRVSSVSSMSKISVWTAHIQFLSAHILDLNFPSVPFFLLFCMDCLHYPEQALSNKSSARLFHKKRLNNIIAQTQTSWGILDHIHTSKRQSKGDITVRQA